MGWFNYYGLAIIAVIMIPNIVYSIANKNGFNDAYKNKFVEICEQIGRFGCIIFMIINVPYTYFNFWFDYGLTVYLSVNGVLCAAYLAFWAICWKQNGLLKALSLSVLPTLIFLFSGIMIANIPLITLAVLFGVTHIFISYKNAVKEVTDEKRN